MSAAQARFVVRLGEVDRRQAYRDEGATSLESWLAERFGVSTPTARTYAHVGEKAWDIPHLVGSLCGGRPLLRQGAGAWPTWPPPRPTASSATRPRSARCESWPTSPARRPSWPGPAPRPRARSEHDASLPALQRRAPHHFRPAAGRFLRRDQGLASMPGLNEIPSDGETRLDQRRCDAFSGIIRSSCPGLDRTGPARPAPMSWSPTSPWPPWSRTQARRAPWPASSSTAA